MSVSRSDVRFASVPALPSRKQGQGFVVQGAAKQRCWAAALRWGGALRRVGIYRPEELSPQERRCLCHSLLFRGVLFCVA